MSQSIKIPGLIAPITLDPVEAATHVIRPANENDPRADPFQRKLAAITSQQIERLRRLAPPTPQLDVQGFLNDLASQLSKLGEEGFRIEIQYPDSQNPGGRAQDSRYGGSSIDSVDGGPISWSADPPMHVASVSKLITAMAMTRALRDYQISADAAIGGYLPYFWTQGPNIGKITFRQLLTHTSGITSGAADYLSMKTQVNQGVDASAIGVYAYANMNFSLCRMLLATILMLVVSYRYEGVADTSQPPGGEHSPEYGGPFPPTLQPIKSIREVTFVNQWPSDDNSRDWLSIQTYQSYVVEKVLIGGEAHRLAHAAGDALAYAYPKQPNQNGWNSGDLSTGVGAYGWHFSTTDLLKAMGDFRRGGMILTQQDAQQMLDDSFGIDWIQNDGAGNFYEKNGLWTDGQRTEQATVFFLPNQTELVVLVNSNVDATIWLAGTVEQVYKAHLA
jgi:hypothetical protein